MAGARAVLMLAVVGALVLMVGGVGGCGASMRVLRVRVDRGGEAVSGAHVRAVPVGTSPIPLPLSLDNLSGALHALGDSGVTDASGVVELEVERDRAVWLEVQAPAFAEDADRGPWSWWLGGGTWELEARGDGAGPYNAVLLER